MKIGKLIFFKLLDLITIICAQPYGTAILGTPTFEFQSVVGGRAELPCNLSLPSTADKISIVIWYRGESKLPLYSVDTRNNALEKAKHFPSEPLGARAYFDLMASPPVLRIEPIHEKDASLYRCRVDYRWGRTLTTYSLLNVIVPPKEAVITNERGEELSGLIGPYDESADVILRCKAIGGKPPPSVTWWRNSKLLDDSYTPSPKGVVRNDITIKNVQRKDVMAIITCQASNNNITIPAATSVTLDINLRPLDIRIINKKNFISAGVRTDLSCVSSGARPPAKISWWIDQTELLNVTEHISSTGNSTTSTLSFWPNANHHGKQLTCKSDNPRLVDTALEDGYELNISYPPVVNLNLGGNKGTEEAIKEGSDVYLHCSAEGNPAPSEIGWLLNGKPISNNVKAGILVNNNTLLLTNIQATKQLRGSNGKYQCWASNREGRGYSPMLQLKINYSPICAPGQKIMYGVAKDEMARIDCVVEADPVDVSFRWVFNSSADKHDLMTFTSSGLQSTASYVPKALGDYGTLYCYGKNSIGRQAEPCVFTIIPVGAPESLHNCSISNITTHSFQVECLAGYDGGLKQHFRLELINSAENRAETNLTKHDQPAFLVTGLQPSSSYVVMVYSVNMKGKSSVFTIRAKTAAEVKPSSSQNTQIFISPYLGVLIGVVAALILVPAIMLLCLRLRNAKKKKERGTNSCETNKTDALLRKEIEEYHDMEAKDPDIIPQKPLAFDYPSEEREWSSMRLHTDEQVVPPHPHFAGDKLPSPQTSHLENIYLTGSTTLPRRTTKSGSSWSSKDQWHQQQGQTSMYVVDQDKFLPPTEFSTKFSDTMKKPSVAGQSSRHLDAKTILQGERRTLSTPV